MPENPAMYLNRITLTVLDDLYNVIKETARTKATSMEALIIEYARTGLGLGPSPRLSEETLREKLIDEMNLYAGEGVNAIGFLTQSEDRSVFAIVHIGKIKDKRFSDASLIARIANDRIIIERDQNDKPLVDALIQAGIQRSQIILAYASEAGPEAV